MLSAPQTDLLVLLFVVVPALLFLSSSIRRQKDTRKGETPGSRGPLHPRPGTSSQ